MAQHLTETEKMISDAAMRAYAKAAINVAAGELSRFLAAETKEPQE